MNAIDLREEAGERDRGLKSIEAAAIEITDRIAEGVEGRRGLLLTAGSAGDESPAPKASGLRGSRLVSDRREGTDRPGNRRPAEAVNTPQPRRIGGCMKADGRVIEVTTWTFWDGRLRLERRWNLSEDGRER